MTTIILILLLCQVINSNPQPGRAYYSKLRLPDEEQELAKVQNGTFKHPSARLCASEDSINVQNLGYLYLGPNSSVNIRLDGTLILRSFSIFKIFERGVAEIGGRGSVLVADELSLIELISSYHSQGMPVATIRLGQGVKFIMHNSHLKLRVAGLTVGDNSTFEVSDSKIQLTEGVEVILTAGSETYIRDAIVIMQKPLKASFRFLHMALGSFFDISSGNVDASNGSIYLDQQSYFRIGGNLFLSNGSQITLRPFSALLIGSGLTGHEENNITRLYFAEPNLKLVLHESRLMRIIDEGRMCLVHGNVEVTGRDLILSDDPIWKNSANLDLSHPNVTCVDSFQEFEAKRKNLQLLDNST